MFTGVVVLPKTCMTPVLDAFIDMVMIQQMIVVSLKKILELMG